MVFTNAVRCLPAGSGGKHPVTAELHKACQPWLRRLIEALDPVVVVTIGNAALVAMNEVERHRVVLRSGVGRAHDWYGRKLLPLYHPGLLGRVTRRAEQQRKDIEALAELLGWSCPRGRREGVHSARGSA